MRVVFFIFVLAVLAAVTPGAEVARSPWDPAKLYSATRTSNPNELLLVFSELVRPDTGLYTFSNGAKVLSVRTGDFGNEILMTVTDLPTDIPVYISVLQIQDVWNFWQAPVTLNALVLPSSLVLWLRADIGVTTDDNGLVYQWLDLSPQFNHAAQFLYLDGLPTKAAAAINGLPAIHFDGIDDYFQIEAAPSLTLANELTIFSVAQFSGTADNFEIMGKPIAKKAAPYDFYIADSSYFTLARGDAAASGHQSLPGNGPHFLTVSASASAATFYADGTELETSPLAAAADADGPVFIGGSPDGPRFMKGEIAEVMAFNAVLSPVDQAAIDHYLLTKYLPHLTIAAAGDGSYSLSWPASSVTYLLEQTETFNPPAWAPAPETVTVADGFNSVSFLPDGGQIFFRLRRAPSIP